MIQRAADATFINAVVNHPAVRPHVFARPGVELDMTAVVASPQHVVLTGEHGAMIFMQNMACPGAFEIHTSILPDGRGPWALAFAHECVDYLFCRTNATEVFTRVPEGNVGAMALARACGAKPEGEPILQDLNGTEVPVTIYSGRIQDWIRIAAHLPARGQEFHLRLAQKYAAAGLQLPLHPENPWHDRHVGAAVGMVLGGQPGKGMLVFNRWAGMAIAPPMRLISESPLVFDITDCRIEVHGGDFEVLPCQ